MYSNEDLGRFYFKYQTEALQSFCMNTLFKTVQFGATLVNFSKKSLRGAGIILHSYPLVSVWSSPIC